MKHRQLKENDCMIYRDDILSMYKTNHLIMDSQNNISINSPEVAEEFIKRFVTADDSAVIGIFDDNEDFLYGLVILDNIRFGAGDRSCAQLHIVNDKTIFGKKIRDIYENILVGLPFTTLYCEIPSIAVHPIAICKRLGFKKTGYVPEVLPYINSKGEEKLYDLQIFSLQRDIN